jgi:phospholipid/cholesterol/gamma-HCH transport system ATP-binding protein
LVNAPRVPADAAPVIEVDSVVTRFGSQVVHNGVSLTIRRGELVALIGGSGTGKSVLLREVIGLQRPNAGRVRLLGTDVWASDAPALTAMRRRFGMMFQDGALFSSLDVAANVATPLRSMPMCRPICWGRWSICGCHWRACRPRLAPRCPANCRAACASAPPSHGRWRSNPRCCFSTNPPRAWIRSPRERSIELLAVPEPRPGLTVLIVTHDLDSLLSIAQRIVVLGRGKVVADGTPTR